jgi:ATP-dependent helicase/nuclease subunit B
MWRESGGALANSIDDLRGAENSQNMNISHIGLGWEQPFPITLGRYLRERFGDRGPFDSLLVWVPSSRFGRHLLAELFTAEEGALHPPQLMTPAQYVQKWMEGREGVASEAERLLAWRDALQAIPRGRLASLFPGVAADAGRRVPFDLAVQLMRLQDELAELEWTMQAVSRTEEEETPRWEVLAELESGYHERLAHRGKDDPNRALAVGHGLPAELMGCRTLLIAAVHNLTPREGRLVAQLAKSGMPVEALWPVPSSELEHFDQWGRPDPDYWESADISDALVEATVVNFSDPEPAIRATVEALEASGEPVDAMALAACEEAVRDCLIEVAAVARVPLYNPEGAPYARGLVGSCLLQCLSWRHGQELRGLETLLQQEVFRAWCARRGQDPDDLQGRLLELRREHLFERYAAMCSRTLVVSDTMRPIHGLVAEMESHLFAGFTRGFLAGLWHLLNALTEVDWPAEGDVHASIEALYEVFGNNLDETDGLDLLRHLMLTRRYYPERSAEERPVSGWLEAPWETAPQLILIGLPDNTVPGGKVQSTFLTPGLRKRLGVPGHREEAALQALRLRILLESRAGEGALRMALYARSLGENPVLPCRFLFNTHAGNTVRRARFLMQGRGGEAHAPAASFGTKLTLPSPTPLKHISVSGLNAYLRNPFRYYLEYRLGWQPLEPVPMELDALRFGQLAHGVLEAFGKDPKAASKSAEAIAEDFEQGLDALVAAQYGQRLPVSLRIQIMSLGQRLRHAAVVLEGLFADGWRIEDTEWAFPREAVRIGGVWLRGRIDLVLRNEAEDRYLLIDYKTSDIAVTAEKAHCVGARNVDPDGFLPEQYFQRGDKVLRWQNLQLPLYAHAFRECRGAYADCGYINLAKAASDIALSEWQITPTEVAAAVQCAEAIVAQIQAGRFPLPPKVAYDDPFLPWFGTDFQRTIDPAWQAQHMEVGT